MLKNKRILALLLVLMLVITISFTACSSKPADNGGKEVEQGEQNGDKDQVEENVLETAAMNYFANMTSSNMLGAEDFINMVLEDKVDGYILDIRTAEDYAKEHIKGAVNLPYGTAISDNLSKIPTDKPVYVYCYSGQTASQTIALLRVAGIDAINITSGFNGGISQVEGFEDALETEANEFPEVNNQIADEIVEGITKFYAAEGNHKIKPADVKEFVDAKDESVVLLDIRQEKDYKEGHIEGAINLPFGQGMEKGFADLPKDKTIIVICYSGQTADQTNAILHLLGFDALGMSGGMNGGWLKEGFPVVTE